jgi:LysM repeat protein
MDEQAFKVYKVRKGDTLQKIARRELGSYAGWLTLYRFNLDRLPHGPNRIEVGQALIVPNRSTVSAAVKR